jgi:hypothetical protein
MSGIKPNSWVETLIEVYSSLGGEAHWNEVYPEAKKIRLSKGLDWTVSSEETIRDCVQRHSSDSNSRKRAQAKNAPDVFYAVSGGNSGSWGLRSDYYAESEPPEPKLENGLYLWGLEGIAKEATYLRRLRDQKLVQARKDFDKFTCQTCEYRQEVSNGQFVIDVHHLNPLGTSDDIRITSIDDLICLCPNCHRIAHSRREFPLSVDEIRSSLNSNNL